MQSIELTASVGDEETVHFIASPSSSDLNFHARRSYNIESAFVKKEGYDSLFRHRQSVRRRRRLAICFALVSFSFAFVFVLTALEEKHRADHKNLINPENDFGQSWDLKLGAIKDWCHPKLAKGNFCECADPLTPLNGIDDATDRDSWWMGAHDHNKEIITNHTEAGTLSDIDIVFLGDSITERWISLRHGEANPSFSRNLMEFIKVFTRSGGGYLDGIALGISGDTTPNLFYRVQHGEIPEKLNPKVFWVLIGINDLMFRHCSEEIVVMGISRVVEEIVRKKPKSLVVISGLLPSSLHSDGLYDHVTSSTLSINKQLKHFSSKHSTVHYFDPPSELTERDEDVKYVSSELMPDFLHPNQYGYKILSKAIVKKLKHLDIIQDLNT